MTLSQLTLVERMSLIGSRILSVSSRVGNLDPSEATEEDIKKIREDLNRVIDLIEESDPSMSKLGRAN